MSFIFVLCLSYRLVSYCGPYLETRLFSTGLQKGSFRRQSGPVSLQSPSWGQVVAFGTILHYLVYQIGFGQWLQGKDKRLRDTDTKYSVLCTSRMISRWPRKALILDTQLTVPLELFVPRNPHPREINGSIFKVVMVKTKFGLKTIFLEFTVSDKIEKNVLLRYSKLK